MQVSLPVGVLIIVLVWSLPVLEVYLVCKFIEWQDFRKRTCAGVEVDQEYLDRLNDREDFWGDGDDTIKNMQEEINRIENTRRNNYIESKRGV